jgi:hypothetical protein
MLVYEVPIDDVKVGALCAMSASSITGHIFSPEAIHSHLYVHTEMIVDDLQFRICVFSLQDSERLSMHFVVFLVTIL